MDDFRRRLYPITRGIALGPFAGRERRSALIDAGVTHLLNVGEAPSVATSIDGPFRATSWLPVAELGLFSTKSVAACLAVLHEIVSTRGSLVYVHSVAGWNRSPTVVWLYLVACGLPPDEARAIITARTPDAVPGQTETVTDELLDAMRRLGEQRFRPHPNPESLEPVPVRVPGRSGT
jgi:protein-tyrosine phosphatase